MVLDFHPVLGKRLGIDGQSCIFVTRIAELTEHLVKLAAAITRADLQAKLRMLALLTGSLLAICWLVLASNSPLRAQVEGDRGIAPIASSGDFEVSGVEVNVTGKDADDAREKGWREAQRLGWRKLSSQMNRGRGSSLSDGALDSMVSAIVVETEMIGPRRYIATLGVLFDRARAGQTLGLSGNRLRSAPMLVIPVVYSAGTAQVFESKTPWQRSWAQFRTGDSVIDYVRPSGSGGDSLILTAGQLGRRSRSWWRLILDQFGAADVIIPIVRLEREFPGGPITGTFTARYGPDNRYLDSFSLTAANNAALPAMMNEAVSRMDRIFAGALARGILAPDPSLVVQNTSETPVAVETPKPDSETKKNEKSGDEGVKKTDVDATSEPAEAANAVFTVQFNSPDAAAIDAAMASVRGASGVRGISISSTAVGGTSVMRVTFAGEIDALADALQARGWQVQKGANALSIRK